MEQISQVAERLNYPSAAKLKVALKAEGIPFNAKAVESLQRSEAVRQVQKPTTAYNGKIVAKGLDSKWFADMIDFPAAPSAGKGQRYILVVT